MKNFVLSLLLILTIQLQLSAQAWTDIGIKVGYGTSWLLNGNIFDDNSYSHQYTWGYNYGAKAGINVGEHIGITFDAIISELGQEFSYTIGTTEFSNSIEWRNLDLYLMFRNSRRGAYFEIGPMLSLVREVKQKDTGVGALRDEFTDVTPFYSENYLSGVIGGGAFLAGGDRFTLMLGMRVHYAFQDFISEAGQLRGTAPSADFESPFPNTLRNNQEVYSDYADTNPLFIQVLLEFNFGVGYFAKTACSGRVKWFSGN